MESVVLPPPSTPQAVPHDLDDDSTQKISAYYSLVFPDFTYYLQTLNVTIGRRCPGPSSSSDPNQVDVDLGSLKSVSRLHAKIEYDEDQERFVLIVVGRNGAWVDGIWSGSGSRVPLSERSQIQIASRTFTFVLPPPPEAPEDSPSPSSGSSGHLRRSPSVDITSMSSPLSERSQTPPPSAEITKHPPTAPPVAPSGKGKGKGASVSKKRKKPEGETVEPKIEMPEVMPPKPQLTYSQLCYRAIRSHDGKATLQDICAWVMENFDWYRLNRGTSWESSIRHNLSSSRAFKKMERASGERGKYFLWAVDPRFEHTLEEQEAKSAAGLSARPSGQSKKKADKKIADPNRPSPFTSAPLALKGGESGNAPLQPSISVKVEPPTMNQQPTFTVAPQAPVTQPPPPPSSGSRPAPVPLAASPAPTSSQQSLGIPQLPAGLSVPIVVSPLPSSYAQPATGPPAPIVLHENTLYLNPAIFAHLAPAQLRALESLGAQKALEILQGYIKRYLDEKIRAAGRGRGRGRGRGTGRGGPPGHGPSASDSVERGEGKPPVAAPAPTTSTSTPLPPSAQRAPSPVIIIDSDDETPAEPVAKRRKVDEAS